MSESRKKLTLKSGGTCVVRGLKVADFAEHGGDIPTIHGEPNKSEPSKRSQVEAGIKVMRVCLLSCVSPITRDGVRKKIVDKELDECSAHETTIGELSDRDAEEIFGAIMEISELGKEVSRDAKTFPQIEVNGGPDGSCSVPIQMLAERSVEAVVV